MKREKWIPKIEADIKDNLLCSLVVYPILFFVLYLILFVGALLDKKSIKVSLLGSLFFPLLTFLILELPALWKVAAGKLSQVKRKRIMELGDRVEGTVREQILLHRKKEMKIRWVIEYKNPELKVWKSPVYSLTPGYMLSQGDTCTLYVYGRKVCLAEEQSVKFHFANFAQWMKPSDIDGLLQIKEGSVPEIKYPIEEFACLSEEEIEKMEGEWCMTANVITESFFRFLSFFILIDSECCYDVYVEIRYEGGKPDEDGLTWVEEEMDEKLDGEIKEKLKERMSDSSDHSSVDYREAIQAEMKREIRRLLEQKMPNVVIQSVFVEPIKSTPLD